MESSNQPDKTAGCCVLQLKRISIDNIILDGSIKPGEWKELV